MGLATVVGFFGRFWWVLDVASELRLQYLQAALVAALIFGLARRKQACAAALAIVLVNAVVIAPLYWPTGRKPSGRSIRLLLANVQTENRAYDCLLNLIRTEQPDLVVLEEINADWAAALAPLKQAYPHHLESPAEDNFGIGLYSKLPLRKLEVLHLGAIQVPSVHAVLELEGATWHIIGTHPLPPAGRAYWQWRNDQLARLATFVAGLRGEVVVLGDLNTTPWSQHFTRLLRATQLRDTRNGFGLQVSWPTFLPRLGIPIDHCLVSRGIGVCDRRSGPPIGSDHYPVLVDLACARLRQR